VKKFGTTTTMLIVAAVAALLAGSAIASATKAVPFTAKYAGNATTKQVDTTVNIAANGNGTATLIGAGKITGAGTGDSSARPCVPFTGPGKMTGAKGTLAFKVIPGSTGCGDEQGETFAISGKAAVVKGTGLLVKAKGTLKFSGIYDRTAGTFTVKFSGTLTK
jgi:hypothetical protein